MYDISFVIGRFQPPHNEHLKLIKHAQDIADKTVIFLGSSFQELTTKNPFTFNDRKIMIENSINMDYTYIEGIIDIPDNDQLWKQQIIDALGNYSTGSKWVLVGHNKDVSSYYLQLFDCDYIDVGEMGRLNATDIREVLYNDNFDESELDGKVSNFVKEYLIQWRLARNSN